MAGGELPDVHSPEFRTEVYNFFLSIVQDANATKELGELIEKTTFDDLTPELWARIHALLPNLKATTEFAVDALSKAGVMMDNREVVDAVRNVAVAEMKGES